MTICSLSGHLGAVALAYSGLALKYVSTKAYEHQSNLGAKSLEVAEAVLACSRSNRRFRGFVLPPCTDQQGMQLMIIVYLVVTHFR
jgi:hypothetical protein